MAIDFDIKDPKNQKLIATFLIPVVILVAFFHFIIKPKMEEVKTKNTELVNLQAELNSVQKILKPIKELEVIKNNLLKKHAELENLLPAKENVAVLLNQFSMVEKDSKVYMVGFEAAETVEGDNKPYRANKYEITIEAGYHQFATFISNVLALPRLLSFSDLNITMNPSAQMKTESYEGFEDQPRYLTIECTLTSYVFKGLSQNEGSQ
ncbi:MAG: type 4a pilus biogenesis protein PilO [Candidatus Latescibacteria bacterium]|jgi:Tfp pilus assembly protein PilO|nr:type 4a pilus biogenesis protein PilO [Candidatus Latescibacterota bacterium]